LTTVLAGADNWTAIVEFAKHCKDRLSSLVDMSEGIPSHDTLERIFSLINPVQFQKSFIEWVQDVIATTQENISATLPSVVAVDGKTLRRSHDKTSGKSAIHMVNGQLKTAEKSNVITAVPELLKLLDIEGRRVTMSEIELIVSVA
jgi:predicted transposase YbfD/YdcC